MTRPIDAYEIVALGYPRTLLDRFTLHEAGACCEMWLIDDDGALVDAHEVA